MFKNSINYFIDLFAKNKLLFGIVLFLITRLLLNFDNYLTIRDFDFYPNYITSLSGSFWNYYIYRPLSAFINFCFMKTTNANILILKHLLGKIYIIIYIPIFLTLCSKFKLTINQTTTALILLLSNGIIFAIYDTLSPYFLIILLSSLQLIFLLESIERKRSLLAFSIVTILASFCHWLTTINFIISLIILYHYRKPILRKKENIIYITLMFLINITISIKVIDWIFFKEIAMKTSSYMTVFFPQYSSINSFIDKITSSILTSIPLLLGITTFKSHLLLIAINIIIFLLFTNYFYYMKKMIPLKIYSGLLLFFFFIFIIIVQISNKILLNSYHYNIPIYTVILVPFLIIIFVISTNKYNNSIKNLLLILFVLIDLILGYTYRNESFDLKNYILMSKSQKTIAGKRHYLVPSFIERVMLNRYPQGIKVNNDSDLFKIDDYKNIKSNNFTIDIVEYNELGSPLYDYTTYKKNLENYLIKNNYSFKKESFRTFTRYMIKNNSNAT